MEPMTSLSDIGYIRVLYTPGTISKDVCGPSVAASLDVTHRNFTITWHNDSVLEDICKPVRHDNRAGRFEIDFIRGLKCIPCFTTLLAKMTRGGMQSFWSLRTVNQRGTLERDVGWRREFVPDHRQSSSCSRKICATRIALLHNQLPPGRSSSLCVISCRRPRCRKQF